MFDFGKDRHTPAEPSTSLNTHQITPSVARGSTSLRPGKFAKISEFAEQDNQASSKSNANQSVNHNPITFSRVSVPHIIHIEDSDPKSRIHDRIMLVIRTNPPSSVTCLSFCIHEDVIDDEHSLDHAKLITETDPQSEIASTCSPATQDAESEYFKLHVSLEYSGCKCKPVEDAYINLKELWNIESSGDVKFAILGKADLNHWPAARQKIIQVFSSTVGDLDRRGSMTNGAPAAADLVTDDGERAEKEKRKARGKNTTTHKESKDMTRKKHKSKR